MVKSFTNTEKLGFVFFVIFIIFLVWMSSIDWVPLGSDFSFVDGVLRVREPILVLR